MKALLLKLFARKIFQPFFQTLHWIALKGMNYGSANSPLASGEAALLKELEKELPDAPVIFDVGANTGQYARLVIELLGKKQPVLHLFEPDPKAYARLVKQFYGHKKIFINNMALGEEEGELNLYTDNTGAVDASLVRVPGDDRPAQPVKVIMLDSYCQTFGIQKIDFLKIDTEGYEIAVLRGAKRMLQYNSIVRIQLEHGSLNSIVMGASLYHYNQLLRGFSLFHLKQDGAYPLRYEPRFDIFYNSNYYFTLKNNK